MNTPRQCKRCGTVRAVTSSGQLRAHRCPHGGWCVPPYSDRRKGGVPLCPACFTAAADAPEQLSLLARPR